MATEFKRIPINLIFPRIGNIRRIIKFSVRAAIANTVIQENGLPDEFALILRPVGDRFEAIAGNTRLAICNELKDGVIPAWFPNGSDAFTGIETLPAFVKSLSDEEAYWESTKNNCHGELTPLEYGFDSLVAPKSKGGRGMEGEISKYAASIGEAPATVRRWRTAAEVLQELGMGDRLEEFNSKTTHLYWVSTAPKTDREALVQKITEGITVDSLKALLPVKAIALKSNLQPNPELFIEASDADEVENFLAADLDSAIAEKQVEDQENEQEASFKDQEISRLNAEMSELKAKASAIMAEAEDQQVSHQSKSSASKALHSSASQESYTPLEVWEDVKLVFGAPVELDAATCEAARSATPTEKYFTKETNGLSLLWECENFIVNPPGGKENQELRTDEGTGEVKLVQSGESNQKLWFSKAEAEYLDGNARQGIYVAFNDALRAMCPSVHQYPICWVDASATAKCVRGGRLCFDKVNEAGDRVSQNSPTHSNFFVFFPPTLENGFTLAETESAIARFEERFKKYGTVTVPTKWKA